MHALRILKPDCLHARAGLTVLSISIAITACSGGLPGGTGTSTGAATDIGGVDAGDAGVPDVGADGTDGSPPNCEPCITDQDCCEWAGHPSGAIFDNYPHLECPGAYPNNWTCTVEGRCINPCDPQVESPCPIPGYECLDVDGVNVCVPVCSMDSECESVHGMANSLCSGVSGPKQYCVPTG